MKRYKVKSSRFGPEQIIFKKQSSPKKPVECARKSGRHKGIVGEIHSIDITFNPVGPNLDDTKDLANGIYLTDTKYKDSEWAFESAKNQMCVCGMGAWELYTEYEQKYGADTNQVIKRRPIDEANNCAFPDPDARMIDKSDGNFWSILKSYSAEGYKNLVNKLTGTPVDEITPEWFAAPEMSYTFPWVGGGTDTYYVSTFYHRKIHKENLVIMETPLGEEVTYWESNLENIFDELKAAGYRIVEEKVVDRPRVTKYIVSGSKKLSTDIINCDYIPVVPCYGEYTYVEGEPHYEGFVQPAMDMQQLINFAMSHMWDHVSRSPKSKPIVSSEQVAGHEEDWEADSETAYAEINTLDSNGNPLPTQVMGVIPGAQISPGMAHLVEKVEQSFMYVANSGAPQDTIDPDASGKAVNAMIRQIAKQWYFFFFFTKIARLRDAEIYISMARYIHDTPKTLTTTLPDGTRTETQTMTTMLDEETGDVVILNDLTNTEFKVTAEIGEGYGSERDRTVEMIDTSIAGMDPASPMYNAALLTKFTIMPGTGLEDLRGHARKQLILDGIKEAETDEEKQMLEQAQNQEAKPDPMMEAATAEREKAAADMAKVKQEEQKAIMDGQLKQMELQLKNRQLSLEEMKLKIEARKIGADISKMQVDTQGSGLDNMLKIKELKTPVAMPTG